MLRGFKYPFWPLSGGGEYLIIFLFVATENKRCTSTYLKLSIGGIMGTTNGETYYLNDECGFDSRGSQFGLSQYN